MPADTIWGVDPAYSRVILRKNVEITTSEHPAFTRDSFLVRAIMRIGCGFPYPKASSRIAIAPRQQTARSEPAVTRAQQRLGATSDVCHRGPLHHPGGAPMDCDHRWKRIRTRPRDHVRCTRRGRHARAIAPTLTGLDGWTFEPPPAPTS